MQLTGIIAALTATAPNVAPTAGDVVNGATVDTQFSSLLLDLGLNESPGDSDDSEPKTKSDPQDGPDASGVATLLLTLNTPPAQPVLPDNPRQFGFDVGPQVQPRADLQPVAPQEAPTAAPVQRPLAFELVIEAAGERDATAADPPQSETAAGEQLGAIAVAEPSSDKDLPYESKGTAAVAVNAQAAAAEEPGKPRARAEPAATVNSLQRSSTAEERTPSIVAHDKQAKVGSDVRDAVAELVGASVEGYSPDRPITRAELPTEVLGAAPRSRVTVATRTDNWRPVAVQERGGPVEPEVTTSPYKSAPRTEQRTDTVDTAPRFAGTVSAFDADRRPVAVQERGGPVEPEVTTSPYESAPRTEQRTDTFGTPPRSADTVPAFDADRRAFAVQDRGGPVEPEVRTSQYESAPSAEQRTEAFAAAQEPGGSIELEPTTNSYKPAARTEQRAETVDPALKSADLVPAFGADRRAGAAQDPGGSIELEPTTSSYRPAARTEQRTETVDTAPRSADTVPAFGADRRAVAVEERGAPEVRTSQYESAPNTEQRTDTVVAAPRCADTVPVFDTDRRSAVAQEPGRSIELETTTSSQRSAPPAEKRTEGSIARAGAKEPDTSAVGRMWASPDGSARTTPAERSISRTTADPSVSTAEGPSTRASRTVTAIPPTRYSRVEQRTGITSPEPRRTWTVMAEHAAAAGEPVRSAAPEEARVDAVPEPPSVIPGSEPAKGSMGIAVRAGEPAASDTPLPWEPPLHVAATAERNPASKLQPRKNDQPAPARQDPQIEQKKPERNSSELDERPRPELAKPVVISTEKTDAQPLEPKATSAPTAEPRSFAAPRTKDEPVLPQTARSAEIESLPQRAVPRPGAVREIAIQLPGSDARPVDLHIVETGGKVHVEVRTDDSRLASTLRDNVGELVQKLDHSGYHAETTTKRDEPAVGSTTRDQGQSGGNGSNSHEHQQQQQQQGHPRGNRPRWLEEIRKNFMNQAAKQENENGGN